MRTSSRFNNPSSIVSISMYVANRVISSGRSTIFFYRFCTDLIAECFIPLLTSILMTKNIWIPLLAAVAFQGLGVILTLFVPETLPMLASEPTSDGFTSPHLYTDASDVDQGQGFDEKWKTWIRQAKVSFGFVTRNTATAALIFTFLISKVGRQSVNILL